jgi:hypothetical protein
LTLSIVKICIPNATFPPAKIQKDERDDESQDFKDNYVESFREGEDNNNSYGYSESASFGLEYTHEIPREKRLEFNEFDLRSEYLSSSSSESSYDWEESRCCGIEL